MKPAAPRSAAALRRYLQARRPEWERLGAADRELKAASLTLAEGAVLVGGYRQLSRDVAGARAGQPGSKLALQLEALYRRLHRRLHAPFEPWRFRAAQLFGTEVPESARRLVPALRVVALLFAAAAAAGAGLVTAYPELAALFASEQMIQDVQRGELWTDSVFAIAPPAVLAAGIAANNIVVTLTAYVLGALYGLGTLYIIGLNGLLLGALFALTAQHGLADGLGRFILAHGPAELSIVLIAGAAGLRLGEALARPGRDGRAQAFRRTVADTGRLFTVCVPFLVLCGLVEGFVSPDPSYGLAPRAAFGYGLAVLLWSALFGRLYSPARAQAQVLVEQRALEPRPDR